MHLLDRDLICNRLRLNKRSSFRIVPPSRIHNRVNSDDVLALLNRARRGNPYPQYIYDIPCDLRTPEEMAAEVEGLSADMLLTWVHRRTKNVPPHFRINSHTVRFSASQFLPWLEQRSHMCSKRKA